MVGDDELVGNGELVSATDGNDKLVGDDVAVGATFGSNVAVGVTSRLDLEG